VSHPEPGLRASCRQCGHTDVVLVVDLDPINQRLAGMERALRTTNHRMEQIMSALDNLRAADEALKTEVAAFLQDIAGRLVSDADLQAVADDINAEVARLQGADPGPAAPAAPEA
jgi:hypothetical protein